MPEIAIKRDMREVILDATERLLAQYGYGKMTLDDIAQEAGIGRRTIYLHFTGKEEVALCSIDRVVDRMLAQLREIATSDIPVDRRVREMLCLRVLARFDSVQDYYQSFSEMFAALRTSYLARRERYFEQEAKVFAEVLAEGEAQGVLSVQDVMATARTLLFATNSLLPYSLSARELGSREGVAERVNSIAVLLLNGLRRRETI